MTTLHEQGPADRGPAERGPHERGPGGPDRVSTGFLDDAALEPDRPPGPDLRAFDRHRVTAVMVGHNGGRWLPYSLAALDRLALGPARVFAVDTASTDATHELLTAELGPASVLSVPAGTGFGAAVAHAVQALRTAPGLPAPKAADGPLVEWLWLLHDDCAPEPETLRRLLAAVDASPSVAVAGPKVRGWHDSSRLLEVGVAITGGGRRETGLDRGELDQGQHDGRRDVLAVGSAGMLVRCDVWDELGGLDPRLPLFRDDVDFGWRANLAGHRVVVVPDAVLHHVEAAAHGRRKLAAVHGSVHRADRRSAVRVLLSNCAAYTLPWHWLRLAVGTVGRILGLLLGKAPVQAWDELLGAGSVLADPVGLARARRARAPLRRVPARQVAHLRPSWVSGLRHGAEAVTALVSGRADLSGSTGSALESGPTSDDADELEVGPSRLRQLAGRTGVQLTLTLLLVSLLAFRGLLFGSGSLQGGALLPTGDGVSSLWQSYAAGWHDVGTGSAVPAPPYLVPLALVATLALGKAWLAVDLLLLLAVPLAALVAYRLLSRVTSGRAYRVVGAVTYALLPAVTGSVATGRLGTAVAAWLLPLALWAGAGAFGIGRTGGSTSRALVSGLLLAVVVAFVPTAWALAALAGVGAVLLWSPTAWLAWARLAAILAVPPLALLPWTGHLLHDRGTLLLEAGAASPSLTTRALPAWHVLAANPGGPGVPAAWLTVPLVLAGLAALARRDRRRAVATAWVVVGSGLLVGFAAVGREVVPAAVGRPVPLWPGVATLLVGGGLLAAAAIGAEGAGVRLASYRFGWRQPVAAVLAALTVLVPLALGVSWLTRGASSVLSTGQPDILPAYVQVASEVPARPRALVLQDQGGGVVGYALVSGQGRRLGDAEVAPPVSTAQGLGPVVSTLLSGTGGLSQVRFVAGFGVGFVVVDAPVDPTLERRLDGTPGLERVSAVSTGAVWRLVPPGARVQLRVQPATMSPILIKSPCCASRIQKS